MDFLFARTDELEKIMTIKKKKKVLDNWPEIQCNVLFKESELEW